jgi:hypothetical protein
MRSLSTTFLDVELQENDVSANSIIPGSGCAPHEKPVSSPFLHASSVEFFAGLTPISKPVLFKPRPNALFISLVTGNTNTTSPPST